MHKRLLFTLLLSAVINVCIGGCSRLITNHYASRSNQPIDGSAEDNDFVIDAVYYPKGNLEHLNDRKKRDNNVYFASANRYNELNYEITKSYLGEYSKYLKVDAKELEQKLKEEQLGVKGEELLQKMEVGELPVHPLKGNILAMQKLKDEENKIAFPDYMEEFMGEYAKPEESSEEDSSRKNFETQEIRKIYATNLSTRDAYVDYYLSWNDDYEGNNTKVFKEKELWEEV